MKTIVIIVLVYFAGLVIGYQLGIASQWDDWEKRREQ